MKKEKIIFEKPEKKFQAAQANALGHEGGHVSLQGLIEEGRRWVDPRLCFCKMKNKQTRGAQVFSILL